MFVRFIIPIDRTTSMVKLFVAKFVIQLAAMFLSWIFTYLLLIHIHATELMWFIFLFGVPFAIALAVIRISLNQEDE